jgi:hypothetical protein
MDYKVIDKNGVAYSDDSGRQVLEFGNILKADELVEKGYFTAGALELLTANKRLEPLQEKRAAVEAETLRSPSNKKAETPAKKGKGKK